MTTLKEFEEALKTAGNTEALEILGKLRERDKAQRSIRPARRVVGKKMTPELAAQILELHRTTDMTQQEIAFQLGVNQGRVNEVIKRGKWLDGDPNAPEAIARDKAKARVKEGVGITPRPTRPKRKKAAKPTEEPPATEASAEDRPEMETPVMETLAVETPIPEEQAPTQAESAPTPNNSEQPVPEKATKEKRKKRSTQPPAQLLFDGL